MLRPEEVSAAISQIDVEARITVDYMYHKALNAWKVDASKTNEMHTAIVWKYILMCLEEYERCK